MEMNLHYGQILNEIDTKREVQEIWCLGDMIAMGPDTNEVLDITI